MFFWRFALQLKKVYDVVYEGFICVLVFQSVWETFVLICFYGHVCECQPKYTLKSISVLEFVEESPVFLSGIFFHRPNRHLLHDESVLFSFVICLDSVHHCFLLKASQCELHIHKNLVEAAARQRNDLTHCLCQYVIAVPRGQLEDQKEFEKWGCDLGAWVWIPNLDWQICGRRSESVNLSLCKQAVQLSAAHNCGFIDVSDKIRDVSESKNRHRATENKGAYVEATCWHTCGLTVVHTSYWQM